MKLHNDYLKLKCPLRSKRSAKFGGVVEADGRSFRGGWLCSLVVLQAWVRDRVGQCKGSYALYSGREVQRITVRLALVCNGQRSSVSSNWPIDSHGDPLS